MDEIAEKGNNNIGKNIILALVGSFVLYAIGVGQLFFLVPLLLLIRVSDKKTVSLTVLVEAVFITLFTLFSGGSIKESIENNTIILTLLNLYIPLSLLSAAVVWILCSGLKWFYKLLVSLIPALVFALTLFLLLKYEPAFAVAIKTYYGNMLEVIFGVLLGPGSLSAENLDIFLSLFFKVLLSLTLPIIFGFICVNLFIFLTLSHSKENDWDYKVSKLELDGYLIWIFLLSFAGIILFRFSSLPVGVGIALFNIAGCISILYVIQGFSVILFRLRNRGLKISSQRLFFLISILFILLQGINILFFVILFFYGVTETFFELRRDKE